MDEIAKEAGVTKRTVYHHFDSKDALVGAVLENQNDQTIQQFQKWVDPEARTPVQFAESLFGKLEDWATRSGWTGSGYSRLVLELADLPGHPARQAAKIHKLAIEDWISGQLKKRNAPNADQKAKAMALLIEGAMTLALVQGDTKYIVLAKQSAGMVLAIDQPAQSKSAERKVNE